MAQTTFSSRIEGFCLQSMKTPQDIGGMKAERFYDQKLGKQVSCVVIAGIHAAEWMLCTEISTEIGETGLVRDLLVQRHGLDMGKDRVSGFDSQGHEGFSSNAGDERCPDIQEDLHRGLADFADLLNGCL